ncbi:MAG TPA: peptidoglycan-binding protein [Brachybacterium paraconglomeratum]|uniref:Peptidoglycan-binding protein n=1 Tax=Brachybacterium paraconglomeratum TaxID=173362 RepID=A0A921GSR3_9MICO|nr:peptidoglycan-binding protein [Brachybacterium paraconglomeratum]
MATTYTSLPAAFSNKRKVEKLRADAAASFLRMSLRLAAGAGNFSIWSAHRDKAEQERLFRAAYTPVNRARRYSTDRAFQGRIWALKSGHLPVASPDYVGGSVGTHRQGRAVDIHPATVQNWIKANGRRFGWTWTKGQELGEHHHFEYEPALDQYKDEGTPNISGMQKALGVTVDGKPGTGFVAAVKKFQQANGLTVDGIAGPWTQKAILGKGDAAPTVPVTPAGGTSVPAPAPERTALAAAEDGIFPWADATTQFWDEMYPTQTYTGGEPIGLLHSTETGTWPGYGAGSSAPHLTVRFDPKARTISARQHFSTTRPSRALVNKAGGVQTNNQRIFQIELIGSCDLTFAKKHGYLYLPDLLEKAWARDALAAVLAAVSESLGIPLTSSVVWANYPGSYGEKASQRLTGDQWEAYTGWLGHQHAPENDHGDPGDIPVAEILAAAGGDPTAVIAPPSGGGGSSSSKLPSGKDALMALIDAPDFPLLRTPGNLCYYGGDAKQTAVSGKMPNSLVPGEITGTGKTSGAEGLKVWQRRMNERGYSLTVDGRYGADTEKAAKNLQRLAGLPQDGAIGPDTWHAAFLLPVVA